MLVTVMICFFLLQAEDGIRDLVRSRGLGDVYKRQLAVTLRGRRTGVNRPNSIARLKLPRRIERRLNRILSLIHI